jgi:hypothetical protein
VPTSRQYACSSYGFTPGHVVGLEVVRVDAPVGTISGMIERPKSWSVERRASATSASISGWREKM